MYILIHVSFQNRNFMSSLTATVVICTTYIYIFCVLTYLDLKCYQGELSQNDPSQRTGKRCSVHKSSPITVPSLHERPNCPQGAGPEASTTYRHDGGDGGDGGTVADCTRCTLPV